MKRIRLFALALCLAAAACAPQGAPQSMAAGDSEKYQNLMRLAGNTQAGGNPEAAAELYRQAAMLSKGAVDAHLELAKLYRQQKRPKEALTALQDAEKLQPKNPLVLSELGMALLASGRQGEAVQVFDRAIAADPTNASAYNGKGVALDTEGKPAAAQEAYRQGLLFAPKSSAIKNNLALSLILSGDYEQAIMLLKGLSDAGEANSTMRQNLALAYGLKGDSASAMQYNLRDLPPEQAQENLRFYEILRRTPPELARGAIAAHTQAAPVAQVQTSEAPALPVKEPAPAAPSPRNDNLHTASPEPVPLVEAQEPKEAVSEKQETAPETDDAQQGLKEE